jgi:hypothetical protein
MNCLPFDAFDTTYFTLSSIKQSVMGVMGAWTFYVCSGAKRLREERTLMQLKYFLYSFSLRGAFSTELNPPSTQRMF